MNFTFSIVIRHLKLDRDKNFYQDLEKFVNQNLGKKYSISFEKLLSDKSTILKKPTDEIPQDRTYFCSELVAAAYKSLGLLSKEIASNKYWPGKMRLIYLF